jgi:hypothetical protein
MRKVLSIVFVGVLVGVCFLALAEENKESNMDEQMMPGRMMDKGRMMQGHMVKRGNMPGMMHPMMMGQSLVATEDGGVVVMIGNKLQKYDKDLVLQKEVEIEVDMKGMWKAMKENMKECRSAHEEMMHGDMPDENKEE